MQAEGPNEVAFDADGDLHAVIGLGTDPVWRNTTLTAESGAEFLGTIVNLQAGAAKLFSDLAAFEALNDPDEAGEDSNPFALVARPGGGFFATDAGGNTVLSIDASGEIEVEAVLDPEENPGPGGPTYQAVPTGAALAPSGALAFGQLTGFPFLQGAAQVFSLEDDLLSVLASGLTNVIDVGFDASGTLYALELDSDRLVFGPGTSGALYEIGDGGMKRRIFGDLVNPTGFAIDANGDFFVSVNGFSPTDGGVVRLAPVSVPAALPFLASGLALLAFWRRRTPSRAG